jgi:hypothetical protein
MWGGQSCPQPPFEAASGTVSEREMMVNTVRLRWYIAGPPIFLLVAAIAWLAWRDFHAGESAARLLSALPREHAAQFYIDASALRANGLLDSIAGSEASEEPDYRQFVAETGFDYRRDLDAVAASFIAGDMFVAARGHFDEKRLADYARAQHGDCAGSLCWMPASRANRYISFRPIGRRVLALAQTTDPRGASHIAFGNAKPPVEVPSAAVWISAPGSAFRDLSGWPDGSHILSPLADAQQVSFTVDGKQIQLDALCGSPDLAASVVLRFTATTNLLRSMLQREKLTPDSSNLSGVLVAGKFESRGSHALGSWPLGKQFLESLFSGKTR